MINLFKIQDAGVRLVNPTIGVGLTPPLAWLGDGKLVIIWESLHERLTLEIHVRERERGRRRDSNQTATVRLRLVRMDLIEGFELEGDWVLHFHRIGVGVTPGSAHTVHRNSREGPQREARRYPTTVSIVDQDPLVRLRRREWVLLDPKPKCVKSLFLEEHPYILGREFVLSTSKPKFLYFFFFYMLYNEKK